ncbi:MAG: DUF952 domain-containing protein [Acidimicrobiia bacterium]|nr:DUF952 domain-containing protein [Acidimicrobiia bacterium]
MRAVVVYKILLPGEWAEFQANGAFRGSELDRADGFVHCSSREQVAATARRVFPAEAGLVIVALDAAVLGEALLWEPAADGTPFPHVHAPLSLDAVVAVHHVAGSADVDAHLPPPHSA